jgi:hypothetical protein
MSLLIRATTAVLIAATLPSFGAGAAPLSASLALRTAVAPAIEEIWWRGGSYYAYDYGYYCPPYSTYYGYNSSAYYGGYAPAYYGGYGYEPYYRRYGYAPRAYGGYWRGY